jgi:hypothetical protein
MIQWETLLHKFKNPLESLVCSKHEKIKDLFKPTEIKYNDIIELSKVLDKEMEELENRLAR